MYQRKPRRFRYRSNGRGYQSHNNGQLQIRSNTYSNDQTRNSFRTTQSAEKLCEKYNALAKAAISSGDKVSGENYLQHADHFMRIIEVKNKNKDQNKTNIGEKSVLDDKRSSENSVIKEESATKNKE